MIEIVAAISVVVSVVSCAVAVVMVTRRQSHALAQVMAACAESNRQFMVYSEKAINRTIAIATPMNYRNLRETSGSIEGAQAPVDGHYDGVTKRRKLRTVQAPDLAGAPASGAELNGTHDGQRHVGTALDFEDNGGGR